MLLMAVNTILQLFVDYISKTAREPFEELWRDKHTERTITDNRNLNLMIAKNNIARIMKMCQYLTLYFTGEKS